MSGFIWLQRPPTYFRMNFVSPVMMVVNPNILYEKLTHTRFISKHILSSGADITDDVKVALKFPYDHIFSRKSSPNKNNIKYRILEEDELLLTSMNDKNLYIYDKNGNQVMDFFNPNKYEFKNENNEKTVIPYLKSEKGYNLVAMPNDDIQYRQAEVIFKDSVSLNFVDKYVFRTNEDLQNAVNLLELDTIPNNFTVNEDLFEPYDPSR